MAKKRNVSDKNGMTLGKQYAVGLFVLLFVLTFSILYIIEVSAKPFLEGQQEAKQIAMDYAGVASITKVSRYTGESSYYSITGKNQSEEDVLVLIPEESSAILVYKATDGISQEEAKAIAKENGAGEVTKVTFGYAKNQPIWEIKSGQTYYMISFENGTFLSKEGI